MLSMIESRLRRPQTGVGLVEVMVSLLVLSIGFLVSANMQLQGMRSNQESYYQSKALMLANDMMDRMRNNRDGVVAGEYNAMKTSADLVRPACVNTGCDAAGLAQLDRYEWSAALHNLRGADSFVPALPPDAEGNAAVGEITDTGAGGVFLIALTWTRQDGETETEETLSLRFIP